jgi:sugar/nucleoside kinase (ribokinase family)
MGERGLLWYDETGTIHALPAFGIARERVIDTSGAGDVFHGASGPNISASRAASAYKIQRLGNEAGLPTLADIASVRREFETAI